MFNILRVLLFLLISKAYIFIIDLFFFKLVLLEEEEIISEK